MSETRTMQEMVVACVRRELKLRETCYPRWVKSGRMKAKVADYEMTAMRDVLVQIERIPGLEATIHILHTAIEERGIEQATRPPPASESDG